MGDEGRVIIIGIDGVPYNLMKDLSDKGVMPNFRELRKDGMFAKVSASIPDVSSVSWSSIITGKNPGEHGVYGFTDIIEGTYTISYHSSRKLRAQPFWQIKGSDKYVIINVPSTYPASKLNGFMVTGFVSPDLERAVYPSHYISLLEKFGYKTDIDLSIANKSKLLLFKELYETLDARVRLYRYLWKNMDWNVFMFVITGSDRLEHFLWNAYIDEENKWHKKFLEFFKVVDFVIGEISSKMNENDSLIILSDHGMELKKFNVNLNTILEMEGFLYLGDRGRNFNSIEYGTKAFALDPGRIYVNLYGRYPRGSVKNSEVDDVVTDLINLFSDLKYEDRKVIRKIYRREEIYRGPFLEKAPDLILVPNSGFNLSARLFRERVFEKDELTGMHNLDAFLYVKGELDKNIFSKNLTVEDILSIINILRGDGYGS